MLTRPAVFANDQFNTGADRHVIVKIVSGSTTWLFSDVDMQITDGHVYPLLVGGFSTSQKVDVYRRTWSVSDITIKLFNADYLGTGALLSDEFGSIYNATVTVYMSAGGPKNVTALSDCLVRFIGTVLVVPVYDHATITVKATESSKLKIIDLPQNVVGDTYADSTVFQAPVVIPLAYGDFTYSSKRWDDVGLAVSAQYKGTMIQTRFNEPAYVACDHAAKTIDNAFAMNASLPEPVLLKNTTTTASAGVTITTSDSGLGTIAGFEWQLVAVGWRYGMPGKVRIWPVTNWAASHSVAGSETVTLNPDAAWDQTEDNTASVQDYLDDGDDLTFRAYFVADDYDAGDIRDNAIGDLSGWWGDTTATTVTSQPWLKIVTSVDYGSGLVNADWSNYYIRQFHGDDDSDFTTVNASLKSNWTIDGTQQEINSLIQVNDNVNLHFRSGNSTNTTVEEFPFMFFFEGVTNNTAASNALADGTTANATVMSVADFHTLNPIQLVDWDRVLWSGTGRKYGSWVPGASAHSEGDLIQDPAGIIESILIDEVGLTTANIDEASFVAAENANITARINFHEANKMDSNTAIKQIAEQSTFIFFWSAEDKPRLVDLSDTTPTTATRDTHPVVIPYAYLVGGTIKTSKEERIFNNLTYQSRWMEEKGTYFDTTTVIDTTSDTAFGTRSYQATWPNVADSAATAIGTFLVGDTGIWSQQHNVIEFSTIGYTGADIQVGDWIEISSDVDAHFKIYGSSWSGKQFLVIALTQLEDSTKIKGIELFG